MIGWAYLGLYWACQIFLSLAYPRRYGNGFTGKALKKLVRQQQSRVLVRYLLWFGIAVVVWGWAHIPDVPFWPVAVGFFIDDYLFGDDEDLKRRWQAAKNSVKWKMKLPEPAPARSGTG